MTVTSSQQHEILGNGLNLLQCCLSAVWAAALYSSLYRRIKRIGELLFSLTEPSGLDDPNQPNLEGEVFPGQRMIRIQGDF